MKRQLENAALLGENQENKVESISKKYLGGQCLPSFRSPGRVPIYLRISTHIYSNFKIKSDFF